MQIVDNKIHLKGYAFSGAGAKVLFHIHVCHQSGGWESGLRHSTCLAV